MDERGIVQRLREYRPINEWGDPVHHVICDQAADLIEQAHHWLDKYARHAGCRGDDKCECGLTSLMIKLEKAVRQADSQTPPRTGSPAE